MKPMITVVGSLNMDMITTSDLVPEQGETVLGHTFQMMPGGKGANQAVAAARLGVEVNMVGMIGEDRMGEDLLQRLEAEHVSTVMVTATSDFNTGTATILLSEQDNRIIAVPGANHALSPDHLEQFTDDIIQSDVVLIQFEIPVETILCCLDVCYQHAIPIIVNPAPAIQLPVEAWLKATYLTPNETEAATLFKQQRQVEAFRHKLLTTVGEKGVYYTRNHEAIHVPAYPVKPIDTTGAGDTFNGALAVAVAAGDTIQAALQFANAAAALSTLKVGAQDGMPNRVEVEQLIKKHV